VDFDVIARRRRGNPLAGLPLVAPERATIIAAMPESERAHAEALLALWGLGGVRLDCRPASVAKGPEAIASYKAAEATRRGCTHFIESDPRQSILIAAAAPHVIVTWWSENEDRGFLIGAIESR